jgi:molybdate transport system permease protein
MASFPRSSTDVRADRARPPIAFVVLAGLGAALVVLPLLGLILRATWSSAGTGLTSERTLQAVRLSLEVSVSAAAIALVLGFPLAWILARTSFPGRRLLRALVILPLVMPPVVGGVGLLTAFGRRGLIGTPLHALGVTLPFSTAGAVLAATFVSFPLMVIAAEAGLNSLDPRIEGAAEVMGASRTYAIRHVTIPILLPQIAAGLVLTWARALGEFGATITFAGNLQGRTQTLPLAVFEAGQTDPGMAILISLLLVGLSLGALVALRGRILGAP